MAVTLLGATLAFGAPPADAAGEVEVRVTVTGDGVPLDGATLTLLDGSTVVDATNESDAGLYELTADPGGYLLSVVPPADSAFASTAVPVTVMDTGTTEVSVALVNNISPPPEDLDSVLVSGRVTNAEGMPGDRLRVQFSSSAGIWFTITDRPDGDYRLFLPPDDYVVKVSNGPNTGSAAGWPRDIDITYVVPVTVASGVDSQSLDVSVPFVPQEVVARTDTDPAEPAVGLTIRAIGADRSPTATVGDAPAIWSLRAEGVTASDGSATLWVLPGTYRMIGLRGADFAADVVIEEIELPTVDPIGFVFEPLVRPELTGRMVNRQGDGIGGGFAIVRAVGTFSPSEVEVVASDGTFRVSRPETDGPFELEIVGPDRSSFGTPTYLDARSWQLQAGPFALTGNEDVGEIVVPGTPAQVCTVGRTTGDPVQAFASANVMIEDVPVGAATGSLTFSQDLSLGGVSSDCVRTVVPPGVEITFEVRPNGSGLDEGYFRTTTRITATFDPDHPDRVEEIVLPVDNFADLDQDTAVDVDLRLVNTAGLPLGSVSVDLTPSDLTFYRSDLLDVDGGLSTRLVREPYVVRSRSALPADRAPKRGDVSVTLALDATDLSRPGVDLGPIELPYVPVDVTVRGADGAPLEFVLLNTTARRFCATDTGIVQQVCARSIYDAPLTSTADRVRTDQFGRARLWLVPATYELTLTPPSTSGFTQTKIPLEVAAGSQGIAQFVQFGSATSDPPALQVAAGGPYTVAEGGTVDLTAIVVAGTADSITWDLSGDTVFDVVGASVVFDATALSGPAVVPVGVEACDLGGTCVKDVTSVTVANVAPVVASVADRAVAGGHEVVVSTTFTDPGAGDVHTGSVEVIGSAPVVATVSSPRADGPGSVEANITAPSCPTEADCEVPVTIRVSDGFASGTTEFLLAVTGGPADNGSGSPVDPDEDLDEPVDPDEPTDDEQPSEPIDSPAEATVDCTAPVAGGVVTCVISGLEPNQTVRATVTVNPILFDGLVTADGEGIATFGFDVPADLADGARLSVAVTDDGGDLADTTLTVAATSEALTETPSEEPSEVVRPETEIAAEDGATSLPRSGGPVDSLLLIALVSAGLGFALVRGVRPGGRSVGAGGAGGAGGAT